MILNIPHFYHLFDAWTINKKLFRCAFRIQYFRDLGDVLFKTGLLLQQEFSRKVTKIMINCVPEVKGLTRSRQLTLLFIWVPQSVNKGKIKRKNHNSERIYDTEMRRARSFDFRTSSILKFLQIIDNTCRSKLEEFSSNHD